MCIICFLCGVQHNDFSRKMWNLYVSMFRFSLFVGGTSEFCYLNFSISSFFSEIGIICIGSLMSMDRVHMRIEYFHSILLQIFFDVLRFKWMFIVCVCVVLFTLACQFSICSLYTIFLLCISSSFFLFFSHLSEYCVSLFHFIFSCSSQFKAIVMPSLFRCWISVKMLSCDVTFD